jgi:predicted small lipoprotein YifL
MKLIIAIIAAGLALSACGGSQPVKLPPLEKHESRIQGVPVYGVRNMAEGDKLCDQIQGHWPASLGKADQVTFDIPHTGNDLTCMKS